MSDGLNHNTKIVNNQGGNELDILEGGELDVEGNLDIEDGGTETIKDGGVLSVKSGGTINIETGGTFSVNDVDITDEIAALANDITDNQKIVGIDDVLIASVGTWTRTRIAQGDYCLRHTPADDTSVLGIDITEAIRTTAAKGFKLASIDVIHKIGTLALEAHTATLQKVAYANNVAVAVTNVPLTGSLSVATQAEPYVNNLAVTTPAFNVTANSKYVFELTVNAAETSEYDFYGLNLHFTKSQS